MYDVLSPRKYTDKSGQEKTTFLKLGVAFDNKNSDGFNIMLHANPLPDKDGEVRLICKKSKPKDQSPSDSSVDDEIPF